MEKELSNNLNNLDLKRICDTCRYDYFCMRVNRPRKSCKDYLEVEKGKTSADYAK